MDELKVLLFNQDVPNVQLLLFIDKANWGKSQC